MDAALRGAVLCWVLQLHFCVVEVAFSQLQLHKPCGVAVVCGASNAHVHVT
jgi:hypothetical protein